MTEIKIDLKDPKYYVNRELSWLDFNYRVLGEARDKTIPLFERLKFLSITASNLDFRLLLFPKTYSPRLQ